MSIREVASEDTGSSYAPLDSKCRDDKDGVAPKCYCGAYTILYRSRTCKNPNKLFFGCPFYKKAGSPYCSSFTWLDKHCTKVGIVKDGKEGEGSAEVKEHYELVKVEERMALLESRVAAIEKLRKVMTWIVLSGVVAVFVAIYAIGN
ncbi:hypothetical protein PIB30_018462 [Stylosanthes scabra]|uniref:Zinc finger GRF-type domain-containing protein n=1 Tax=Stylosanthes scabra TaxID=79078 RepID=A0ABU6V7T3_9FABA|nr:hypothetical protein [Stylosanthes scabra]